MADLEWCFKIKTGLRIAHGSEVEAKSYEKTAVETLEKLEEETGVWKIVKAYYACYYAAYSIILSLGVKSENHTCTFELLKLILKLLKKKTRIVSYLERLKEKRISAQYYLRPQKIDEAMVRKTVQELLELKKEVRLRSGEINKKIREFVKLLSEKEM